MALVEKAGRHARGLRAGASKVKSFVIPAGQQSLLDCLAQLDPKKRYRVTVEDYKKSRSLGLNAFHWATVITPIADFVGQSPEETHRDLCGSFWGWVDTPLGGRKPWRTTTRNYNGERNVLDWEAMSNFIHHCQQIAAELGVPIPEYNEEAA